MSDARLSASWILDRGDGDGGGGVVVVALMVEIWKWDAMVTLRVGRGMLV